MRRYIRHPSDVPIIYDIGHSLGYQRASLKNASKGGIAFQSPTYIEPGSSIHIHIPQIQPPIKIRGHVVWCHKRKRKNLYDIGVKFIDEESKFRIRMVEQVCHIEHYKQEVYKKEGRQLTGDQAAHEWIERYAKDFPGIV
jgi:hypothetical protein